MKEEIMDKMERMDNYDWMEEARQSVEAMLNCRRRSGTVEQIMSEVKEDLAICISNWMQTAAQNSRNTDYYRGLLERCGEAIGEAAYIQDDGGISEDVLCAKIPELVEKLVRDNPAQEKPKKPCRVCRVLNDGAECNCTGGSCRWFDKECVGWHGCGFGKYYKDPFKHLPEYVCATRGRLIYEKGKRIKLVEDEIS